MVKWFENEQSYGIKKDDSLNVILYLQLSPDNSVEGRKTLYSCIDKVILSSTSRKFFCSLVCS